MRFDTSAMEVEFQGSKVSKVEEPALDTGQRTALYAAGQLVREVLCQRVLLACGLAADFLTDGGVVTGVSLGEADCDLIGGEELAAEVMARFSGLDLEEDLADARFNRKFFPIGHVFCSGCACCPDPPVVRPWDHGWVLRCLCPEAVVNRRTA